MIIDDTKNHDEFYMRHALKQAQYAFDDDEVPVGAVIVHQKRIIARAYNQIERLKDPTAHAEMIALTQATAARREKWLYECTLYVTIEPCMMCAGALVLARLERVVFGACDIKTGAFGSRFNVNSLQLNHQLEVESGVLAQDCGEILTLFFQRKRKKG